MEEEDYGIGLVSTWFVRFEGETNQFFIILLSKIIRLKYEKANAKNIAKTGCRLAVTRLAVSDPLERRKHRSNILQNVRVSWTKIIYVQETRTRVERRSFAPKENVAHSIGNRGKPISAYRNSAWNDQNPQKYIP